MIISPAFKANFTPIVISFDNNYCLAGAALLKSILQHSSPQKNYDIIILEDRISTENKKRLQNILRHESNFSLRFFDANTLYANHKIIVRHYFSPIVYARLFIPQLFREYDKIIYIDSDTIVQTDLSELLEIDLNNNYIAAVKDIVMEVYVQFKVKSIKEAGGLEAQKYLTDILGVIDPSKYFQAGLLVFNIPIILKTHKDLKLIDSIGTHNYWFLDQDILNKSFYDNVHYLPLNWNVYSGNGDTKGFFSKLKKETYSEYMDARTAAKVIHFAGDQKPWINKKIDFFEQFEENVRGTIWETELNDHLKNTNFSKKMKGRLTPLMNSVLPLGSERRIWVRNIYYKLNSLFQK